jgi:recombination associated protein RdgC
MWFKQIQIFQLSDPIAYEPEKIADLLLPLAFTSCLPSMHSSAGWVAPVDVENAALVHGMNGNIMLCLQFEEKILPAAVIRQELNDKIKQIELLDDRKVRSKEKLNLKDEVIITLLPRAFTKLSRVYAYIDTKNNRLVMGTTNSKKIEQFISLFKKSVSEGLKPFEISKVSPIITLWLKTQNYPKVFSVEKTCMLQDPSKQNRIIRCQQQDLFAASIQSLIKDGCEVKQLALCWHDRVNFVIAEDFTLRSIQYQEDVLTAANDIESETKQQQFDADFFIMAETLSGMLGDLLEVFTKSGPAVEATLAKAETVAA